MSNQTIENGQRIASSNITHLDGNEIFVFGSNIQGSHAGGAAWYAYKNFDAKWGVGEGLTGRSYALPTMEGEASLHLSVQRFCCFAKIHPEYTFLVTAVGCGIAGYTPRQVAPLFRDAMSLPNVYLPRMFWEVLE